MLKECATPLSKKIVYSAIALLVVLTAFVTEGSAKYAECYGGKGEYAKQYSEKEPASAMDALWRGWRCTWIAIDENEGIDIAVFTGLLVAVTGLLWFGADRTARHQLRAYIAVSFDPPGIDEDGRATIRMKNVGQTPANINGVLIQHSRLMPPLPEQPPCDLSRYAPQKLVLAPTQEHFFFEPVSSFKPDEAALYILGYVDYSDVWGQEWRIGFARQYKSLRNRTPLYSTHSKWMERMNLVPIDVRWWNYDRSRKRSEEIEAKAHPVTGAS